MRYKVVYSASYEVEIEVGEDEELQDAIADINIPEDYKSVYRPFSFNVMSIHDEHGDQLEV